MGLAGEHHRRASNDPVATAGASGRAGSVPSPEPGGFFGDWAGDRHHLQQQRVDGTLSSRRLVPGCQWDKADRSDACVLADCVRMDGHRWP
ncbi:MAG: hypothetical protein M3336_18085 [Chloroflexota bacterium]|nr:hypothetical protein [Chloroflexota bacterium]